MGKCVYNDSERTVSDAIVTKINFVFFFYFYSKIKGKVRKERGERRDLISLCKRTLTIKAKTKKGKNRKRQVFIPKLPNFLLCSLLLNQSSVVSPYSNYTITVKGFQKATFS